MRRSLPRLCLLALTALAGGCLEFKEQTMSYRYDKDTDTLRIYQDYRGIFGQDAAKEGRAGGALSDEELQQLRSVLKGQRTFFFENWIFEYDRESMERARTGLKDPETSKFDAADAPKIDKLLRLAIDNVRIANGPFYLGADGELCGVQAVTVGKFSEIVAALNECAPAFMKKNAEEEDTSPADRQAIAKFGKSADPTMLRHAGNALTLRWPMSRASFDRVFGDKIDDPTRVQEMRTAGIGIAWLDEVALFTLGDKDETITTLTMSSSSSAYTPNAIAPARAKHFVEERFDAPAAAKAFLLGGKGDK